MPISAQSNTEHLDRTRIVGMSAAIALNLVAMIVLLLPGRHPFPSNEPGIEQSPMLEWVESRIEPRPESPAPEIVRVEPRPAHGRVDVSPKPAAMSAAAVLPAPILEGHEIAGPSLGGIDGAGVAATGSGSGLTGTGGAMSGVGSPPPRDARLTSIDAPEPSYPFLAARHGNQGSVYLRVLVGADGKVVSVDIARSSGYVELDNAARRQVMRAWTFQPEIRDGKPVAASGIVVVNFKVKRG